MSPRSCASAIFPVLRRHACDAGRTAIDLSRSATEFRDLPFRCLTTAAKPCSRLGTKTARAGWRFVAEQFGVNAMFKTALAMSIVICGAIIIYETFHQDSWWY